MRRLRTDWTGLIVAGVIIIVFLTANRTIFGETGSGFKNYSAPAADSANTGTARTNSERFATAPSGTLLPQTTPMPQNTSMHQNTPALTAFQQSSGPISETPLQTVPEPPLSNTAQTPAPAASETAAQTPAAQTPAAQVPAAQSGVLPAETEQSAVPAAPPTSGVLQEGESTAPANGILPPPEGFSMTAEEEKLLDQFLIRWEEFGRHIKRVACEVQIKEHDGGLFMQNTKGGKIPLSHTWGKFKFITPNRLSYHVEGEYAYQPGASSDDEPTMEFKKGSGELKYVCDGKNWAEYDYKNRIVNIYAIPEDQWNQDLSMDGPIPLFFIANAKNLKNRFYLNIVTPKNRTDSEVWIEAYPRQIADSGSFQRIIIILSLTDLQPTYMRKYYVNGKSYSELWFQNVTINKGIWKIEADVDFGWEKKIMDETFAISPIESAAPANAGNAQVKPTSGTLPAE